MIDVKDSGRRIEEADLVRVEHAMGSPLPEAYRAFLLRHNGGHPIPDTIDIKGAHFKATDVNVLLGIDLSEETSNILWNLEVLQGCKENHLLPIASDSGGNIFVLDLVAGEDYGKVYYFHRRDRPPTQFDIAPDFNAFLDQIRDLTPEERANIGDVEPQAFQGTSFFNVGRKVTNEDLERLESIIGRPLPARYREYLLTFNGGEPDQDYIDIPNAPFGGSNIEAMFGIDAENEDWNLTRQIEILGDCKENQRLPIARDGSNNYYMLDLSPDEYGRVYYFDAETASPPEPYLVAKDFDEFVFNFRDLTPQERGESEPVNITLRFSGSRPVDEALANQAAGFE